MPKYKIAIGRPMSNGTEHQEVSNLITYLTEQTLNSSSDMYPWIEKLEDGSSFYNIPISTFPTDCSRNQIVKFCQKAKVDFLWMIDSDCVPSHRFINSSFHFLRNQKEPSVIAVPYCAGDGEVQVFQFTNSQPISDPFESFALTRFSRSEASHKKGIEEVASLGTHFICYDMRVFDKIPTPYFKYSYNLDHTSLFETEDTYCHRQMLNHGINMYVDWDNWAGHWKLQLIHPPVTIPKDKIPEFYLEKAKASLQYESIIYSSLPDDVPGWSDFAPFYVDVIKDLKYDSIFVEIGCYFGKSIIHAVKQSIIQNKKIKFYAVDSFDGQGDYTTLKAAKQNHGSYFKEFKDNLEKHKVSELVFPLVMNSVEASERFENNSIDFCFIDANHSYESVKKDIEVWLPKIKNNGILAGHDFDYEKFPGVVKAVKDSFPLNPIHIEHRTWFIRKQEIIYPNKEIIYPNKEFNRLRGNFPPVNGEQKKFDLFEMVNTDIIN